MGKIASHTFALQCWLESAPHLQSAAFSNQNLDAFIYFLFFYNPLNLNITSYLYYWRICYIRAGSLDTLSVYKWLGNVLGICTIINLDSVGKIKFLSHLYDRTQEHDNDDSAEQARSSETVRKYSKYFSKIRFAFRNVTLHLSLSSVWVSYHKNVWLGL